MHHLNLLVMLFASAFALPQPANTNGSLSSTATNPSGSGVPKSSTTSGTASSSISKTGTSPPSTTKDVSSSTSTTIISTLASSTTSEIISRTWEVTATQTSFVPVSSSVTEIDSKTYYSTWISVIYPTTVITSTEYVTKTIDSTVQESITTVVPGIAPQVTFECVCPAPVTETVYVLVTDVPATTITEAILHTYTSSSPNGQTTTTVIPIEFTSTQSLPTFSTSLSTIVQPTGTGVSGQAKPT